MGDGRSAGHWIAGPAQTSVTTFEEDFMSNSLDFMFNLLLIVGLVGLVAACAPPPPEPEPIVMPIVVDDVPLGKYK